MAIERNDEEEDRKHSHIWEYAVEKITAATKTTTARPHHERNGPYIYKDTYTTQPHTEPYNIKQMKNTKKNHI